MYVSFELWVSTSLGFPAQVSFETTSILVPESSLILFRTGKGACVDKISVHGLGNRLAMSRYIETELARMIENETSGSDLS